MKTIQVALICAILGPAGLWVSVEYGFPSAIHYWGQSDDYNPKRVLVYEDYAVKCWRDSLIESNPHWVRCYDRKTNEMLCRYRVLSTDDIGGNSAATYYNCASQRGK